MGLFGFLRGKPKSVLEALQSTPEFRQQKELFDAMSAMCEGGVDADEMPNGTGEYGLAATNPIPCRTILGSTAYLGRLRAADGTKVNYKRIGSIQSEVSPQPIDMYEISHRTGQRLVTLHISPYQKRISGKAPRGFILAENSFAQVTPERIRDESIRSLFESIFPIDSETSEYMLDLHEFKFGELEQGGAPLIVTLRLISFDVDVETSARSVKEIFEQDIFLGCNIPLPSRPSAISRDYREAMFNMAPIVRQRLKAMDNGALTPFDLLDNIPISRFAWEAIDA